MKTKGKHIFRAYHQVCSVFTIYTTNHPKFSLFKVPDVKIVGSLSIKENEVYFFGGMNKDGHLPD